MEREILLNYPKLYLKNWLKLLEKDTFSVLQVFNSAESIQAVILDNTATNNGPISVPAVFKRQ